ncbi:hypothetical protein [Frondihabitans cladoniiphilus]|uniref:Dolichyl-phosphate-mannose-protein mannosyltransferase n=1 Tax=Frondihabitans cladoniiphilus TaxID=715785 RepID=A0ABP8WCG7_9MICO
MTRALRRHDAATGTLLTRWAPLATLAIAFVVGVLLRLQAIAPGSAFNGDEAVTGVMVRHILRGENQYVYFTGQEYNGSLEQYIQAAMYAIFRLPETPFTLRLVQVAFGAATIALVYVLTRFVMPNRWPAVAAAAYFAAGPYFNVLIGTESYGAYDSRQLVALVGVVIALRVTGWTWNGERKEPGRWAVALWLGAFGVVLGLTVWLGLPALEVLVMAAVWLLPTLLRSWRGLVLGILGIVVGAGPVLVWVVTNGRLPTSTSPQTPTSFLERAHLLFSYVARQYLGLAGPPRLQSIVILLLVAVLLAAWVVRARGLLGILTLRLAPRRPGDLILAIIPVAVLIYLASSYTWFIDSPRYLNVLFPVTAVAFGMLVHRSASLRLPGRGGSRRVSAVLVSILAVLLVGSTVSGTARRTHSANASAEASFASAANMEKAEAYLESHGDLRVYADYWTALPAQYYDDDEKIAFAPLVDGKSKGGEDNALVEASPTFVYMTSNQTTPDRVAAIKAALDSHGVTYDEVHIGRVTIFDDLSKQLRPNELGLITF